MSECRMFVLTDASNNNNKFWEITLNDDGSVVTRNGRVGAGSQVHHIGSGRALFESKIREKNRKKYKEVQVVGKTTTTSSGVDVATVKQAATEQIANGNPVLTRLIARLAEANRHQIFAASGGRMDLNLSTGIISTPVGVVTRGNIVAARAFLDGFETFVVRQDFDNKRFMDAINEYLMLVPQKVGASRGWHRSFLPDLDALRRQSVLLDQLESSIAMAEQDAERQRQTAAGSLPKVFDVALDVLEDKAALAAIHKFYNDHVNLNHVSRHLKPVAVYSLKIAAMDKGFAQDGAKLGNVQRLWHGTRTHNVLSILKSGLVIPKSGGSIAITGRMFGDGLYFSDQSTKSLNYSYGYWDGNGRDNKCFMFLADVAMGKSYIPKGATGSAPLPRGYDSCFAKARVSGVQNNEMIVYRLGQANLTHLVEFSS